MAPPTPAHNEAAQPPIRDLLGVALRSVRGILPAIRRPVHCRTGREKMRRLQCIGIAAFMCFATSSALAQITIGPFPIDGFQEVPPVRTPASGVGIVTLQPSGMLDFNINFGGLLAHEIAAHFHGPAPVGVIAPVTFPLPLGSPKLGSVGPLNATQQSDLLNGLWYITIHSGLHPTGEIRGQVIPAPGAVGFLTGFGLLAMGRRRR